MRSALRAASRRIADGIGIPMARPSGASIATVSAIRTGRGCGASASKSGDSAARRRPPAPRQGPACRQQGAKAGGWKAARRGAAQRAANEQGEEDDRQRVDGIAEEQHALLDEHDLDRMKPAPRQAKYASAARALRRASQPPARQRRGTATNAAVSALATSSRQTSAKHSEVRLAPLRRRRERAAQAAQPRGVEEEGIVVARGAHVVLGRVPDLSRIGDSIRRVKSLAGLVAGV
jgi:hypothetical protein